MKKQEGQTPKTFLGKDNFLANGVLGVALLETRRKKETGLYPVKFRLTHQRKQIYINAGYDYTITDWKKLQNANKTHPQYKEKTAISAELERIKTTINDIAQVGEYSHEKLIKLLKKGRKEIIYDAFEAKVIELETKGQVSTASIYNSAKIFIETFQTGLRFIDVTPKWLEKFEDWAINEQGITYTTLSIWMRSLRAIVNDGIRANALTRSSYPFHSKDNEQGYVIPEGSGTKIALTIEQMASIINLDLPENTRNSSPKRCRDLFLLSFYMGGMNFKDLLRLKWKDIKGGEVSFIRSKTARTKHDKKPIVIALTPESEAILKRWGNADRSNDAYILPYLSIGITSKGERDIVQSVTRQTNKQLKKIGLTLGIEGLSTYVARHSFATILKNSGVPVAFISETLGHSSQKTTDNYLKGFETDQRKKNFEVISQIGKNGTV